MLFIGDRCFRAHEDFFWPGTGFSVDAQSGGQTAVAHFCGIVKNHFGGANYLEFVWIFFLQWYKGVKTHLSHIWWWWSRFKAT